MLSQRKLQNLFFFKMFLGILFVISNCLAQGGTWIPKASIPTARALAASCELNGKIYVLGGQASNNGLSTLEVYEQVTDTWDTNKEPMPTAREELCVVAVNGKIYAIGGASAHTGSPLGIVQEYDPLTDTWDTNKQPMPTPRMGMACGVINNKIYVAGGSPGPNWVPSNKLEIYDPAADTWTTGANMLAARYACRGAVLDDTLYVIGGLIGSPWKGQKTVQKYDPTSDIWVYGTNLTRGRVGHSTDTLNGKIYAIGGDTQPPLQENVEEYDPQTKTWKVTDTTPTVINLHASTVYDDEIYIFSGSSKTIAQMDTTNIVYSYKPIVTSIEKEKNFTANTFYLSQNYPNPFNPSTHIQFSIPKTEFVTLKIYNILGEEVATLVSDKLASGSYMYEWNASNLASGVYLYRLEAGEFVETKKLVLLR